MNITIVLKTESVFSPTPCFSIQAQIIAQAIGQAFGVAYQQFLQANGIKASDLRPSEYSDYLESQELYNGDLAHFSDSQNLKDVSRVIVVSNLPPEYGRPVAPVWWWYQFLIHTHLLLIIDNRRWSLRRLRHFGNLKV